MRTADRSSLVAEAIPVAAAIGVFGVVYGATAAAVIGPGMAVTSSLLLFSGAAQYTMVGLVDAGAAPTAVLLAVALLGLRHLPLAAVVLPRLDLSRGARALLGLVLLDETAGLALASPRPPARTMAVVGAAAYAAWVGGTLAGVLGADLLAAASVAEVVFVVLFVGLAALTCRAPADAARAAAAAAGSALLLLALPSAGALGAIAVAVACAATVARRRR
ncbi:MAG TPA: AzlC family ABC transporter permease [Egibacteraceae bacterium]